MAAIPFYIVIGDRHLNGPTGPGLAPQPGQSGTYWTNSRNRPLLMQTVPTTGTAYLPWWDGTAGPQLTTNAATTTTVTVTPNPGWSTNQHANKYVTVDGGVGGPVPGTVSSSTQRRLIVSNTSNTLTISGTWVTPPTASVIHINEGQWVIYDHVRRADFPLRSNTGTEGDNWYAPTFGGFGFTASLMQLLKSYHPGGFKCIKYATVGNTATWKDGQSSWAVFEPEFDKALAALAAEGNTPDYKGIIYWSSTDIETVNLGYVLDAINVCADLRAKIGDDDASVPIWFVNNSSDLGKLSFTSTVPGTSVTAPMATIVRQVNHVLRAGPALGGIENFHLLDMEGAEFSADSALTYAESDEADPNNYSTEDHIELGERAFNAIVRYYADEPVSETGTMPVVIFIGDSQGVGSILPNYAILGNQEGILGPTGTVRATEWIWDDLEKAWQLYDVTANANTMSPAPYYGPEAAMLAGLKDRFPGGVAMFKMAQGGASMTHEAIALGALNSYDPATDSLWPQMGAAWDEAKLAMVRDFGLVPDVVGLVMFLGDNDSRTGNGPTFAQKLPVFVSQLRERFTTRATGDPLPIFSHQPPAHVEGGGLSALLDGTAKAQVRAALVALAASDTRFHLIDDSDLDLQRGDDLHYTGRSQDTIGYRAAEDLIAVIDGDEGETETSGDVPSGAATFVVETGSGVEGANAYCSVAFADSFHEHQGNPLVWLSSTTVEKQDAIRQGTQALDTRYGQKWAGLKASSENELAWPRVWVTDPSGDVLDSSTIPKALQRATAMFALYHRQGIALNESPAAAATSVQSETKTIGAISVSKTYAGANSSATQFRTVDRMLAAAGLIEGSPGGGWGYANA